MRRVVAFTLLAVVASAQVCRLTVAGLNQSRRVTGPVNSECPSPFILHTSPFGNWGVASNYGPKLNGHQFEGWCHDSLVCDGSGLCRRNCQDGWYEWNSCTDHAAYRAPNCSYYNAASCTAQASVTGVNVLGTQTVDVRVTCPRDTDGDGYADQGGCRDLTEYSHGANYMSIYELDPASADELIQTLHFPATPVSMTCGILGCAAAGSAWTTPAFYQSPDFPPKIYAELATVVSQGVFADPGGTCRFTAAPSRHVSAASQAPGFAAPESLVTAYGDHLATLTGATPGPAYPYELGGATVRIRDAAGAVLPASLLFASPRQVNYHVPAAVARGPAEVKIRSGSGVVSTGAITIARTAPGLFTADGSGAGVAAAHSVQTRAGQPAVWTLVAECAPGPVCAPVAIPAGSATEPAYLILYGTGIRGGPVTVTIGGIAAEVLYAGPQGQFPGLDQINVRLPAALAGRGVVSVALTADGVNANPVSVRMQ